MSFLKATLKHELSAPAHTKTLDNGTQLEFLDTGVLRITPLESNAQRVLLSCGVHGNETAPIEIIEQLFQEIAADKIVVKTPLMLIIANPAAINKSERFIDENLNRLFCAKHEQSSSQEAHRAAKLERYVRDFFQEGDEPRFHYDLHTAIRGSEFERFAVYPYLHDKAWSHSQIAFLEQCGMAAVLLSNQPSGTFSYFTSREFNAHSFTVELGKVRPFGENNMTHFTAVINCLRDLISGKELFASKPKKIQVFSVVEEVIKRSRDFKLHFLPDAKNFTAFPKGSILASDRQYQYKTQQDGERFVFPNENVPIGQRAMMVVAPFELTE